MVSAGVTVMPGAVTRARRIRPAWWSRSAAALVAVLVAVGHLFLEAEARHLSAIGEASEIRVFDISGAKVIDAHPPGDLHFGIRAVDVEDSVHTRVGAIASSEGFRLAGARVDGSALGSTGCAFAASRAASAYAAISSSLNSGGSSVSARRVAVDPRAGNARRFLELALAAAVLARWR